MRVARVVFAFCLLAAPPALAQVAGYEWVTQAGRNNLIDSNPSSCGGPGVGCFNRIGGRCATAPDQLCDLQLVPEGRCTSGSLAANGGPGGTNTCVWPHGAGRCAGDTRVGCVTDVHLANPASTSSGPASMCAATGNGTCDMTLDPFGGPFRPDCRCDGEDPNSAVFETAVCGGGGAVAVCSDGDPDRDGGGYGWAIGLEVYIPPIPPSFAGLGPSV